jgi:quercetin dioxygenase-like cupin family protein
MTFPTTTPWPSPQPPSEPDLEALFRREGLSPSWWSNAPGNRYGAHSHPYHKACPEPAEGVLYCARGSIRFVLDGGQALDLSPGDRLDVPPGTTHSAVVGPRGVTCVEAPRT